MHPFTHPLLSFPLPLLSAICCVPFTVFHLLSVPRFLPCICFFIVKVDLHIPWRDKFLQIRRGGLKHLTWRPGREGEKAVMSLPGSCVPLKMPFKPEPLEELGVRAEVGQVWMDSLIQILFAASFCSPGAIVAWCRFPVRKTIYLKFLEAEVMMTWCSP